MTRLRLSFFMEKTMKTKWIVLFLLAIAVTACTPGYLPIGDEHVHVHNDIGYIETPVYSIAVRPSYWSYKPDNLSDYYTAFEVQVENKTHRTISVLAKDVVLLDQNRRQYDPVSTDEIIHLLIDESPSLRHFSDTPVTLREEQEWYSDQLDARQKLMSQSFHFGDISPKATKSGFVFFQKVPVRNINLEFLFKDQTIRFTREKPEK